MKSLSFKKVSDVLWLAKLGSEMPSILHFEIEYLLEVVYGNPPFLSRPSRSKIETAIIWW